MLLTLRCAPSFRIPLCRHVGVWIFFRSAWATLAHLSPKPGVLSVLPYANVFEPLFVGVAFAFTFEFVCF